MSSPDLLDLFEPSSPLGQRLAASGPWASGDDLIARARALLSSLSEPERISTLNAHPRIGDNPSSLSSHSLREQGALELPRLRELNDEYERRFGFRFVVFVNRRPKHEILRLLEERLGRSREEEMAAGLEAILQIADDRLQRARYSIRYGKAEVSFYRTHARPLEGVAPIPESGFTGRPNLLFAGRAWIDVFGDNFMAAYIEGDNSAVVATDTMKNFVHAMALEFGGSTYEQFAAFLASRFLETYAQMERLGVRVHELPFQAHSEKLLGGPLGLDHTTVDMEADRHGILDLECGRRGLRLLKLRGSSFQSFARDQYTTLPERVDRALYIHLNVAWRYRDASQALSDSFPFVPSEQVRDVAIAVFDGFVSRSIQHLLHEMGRRLLDRFEPLAEVSFEAENRLWDTSAESDVDAELKVYSDPKPAHGVIGLRLAR